jgi:hypothetical protein
MTDLTPADRALLAWHTLPCRYPSCRQPVGRRCVTAKGDRTSPHAIRLADLDIWLSRGNLRSTRSPHSWWTLPPTRRQ